MRKELEGIALAPLAYEKIKKFLIENSDELQLYATL